ncbi:peptide chain release factor-like protein [Candidatus Carsonella ruddii]|nr:peptide chain release factor-like protein [Candidatus Carsonella ruddii]
MNKLIFEIRQGVGGDEAIYFAKDLYKMYTKFFNKKNIYYNVLNNLNYKEIIIEINSNIYENFLIKESGVHRVQRIPKNENNGKLHTSTCTIFVSKNNNNNILIKMSDLKFEVCKSSGAGGQHVNTTNSSVKVTYLPKKISVECSDERSQVLNKAKAINILKKKIEKNYLEEKLNNLNIYRKQKLSNSDRAKKIRTYNYPNNKIINHLNGNVYFKMDKILNGNLEIIFKN